MKKIPNWKAPRPDVAQRFWLKNFTNFHKTLAMRLSVGLEGETPPRMTKRRTVLIQKSKLKGNEPSSYLPVTCLHLTWKLLTGRTADEIYGFLENKGILLEKQRGCRRNSKGAEDKLNHSHKKEIVWKHGPS